MQKFIPEADSCSMLATMMLDTLIFSFRIPNQLPSISFTGKRRSSNMKGKKPKVTTYDRDIVCLPFSYPSTDGRYSIPRKESRANLASNGLIGKIRLASDMEEDEILSEIRSVFASAMGHDPAFPFSLLQRCGPGTNALTAPSLSLSFSWTAREVIRLAGQGCIYVKAERELVLPRRVEVHVSIVAYVALSMYMYIHMYAMHTYMYVWYVYF